MRDQIGQRHRVEHSVRVARLAAHLARAHGLDPLLSEANFVLVPRVPGLRDTLARHRVVVRDCASFGLPDHIRIAVPGPEGLARLDGALTRSVATVIGGSDR